MQDQLLLSRKQERLRRRTANQSNNLFLHTLLHAVEPILTCSAADELQMSGGCSTHTPEDVNAPHEPQLQRG